MDQVHPHVPAHVPAHVAETWPAIPCRDGTETVERQQLICERSWVQALPGFTFTSLSRSLCSPSWVQTFVFTLSVSTASVLQTLVSTGLLVDVAVALGDEISTRQRPVKARRLSLTVVPLEPVSPYKPTSIGRI